LEERAAAGAEENKFLSERDAEAARIDRDRLIQITEGHQRQAAADKIRARTLIGKIEETTRTIEQLEARVKESPQLVKNARKQMEDCPRRIYSPNGADQTSPRQLAASNSFLAEEPAFIEAARSLLKNLRRELDAFKKELAELQ